MHFESTKGGQWSDMTQEAPRKVLTTAYPRSRQRFVGAESDVNVVSAVTCCQAQVQVQVPGQVKVRSHVRSKRSWTLNLVCHHKPPLTITTSKLFLCSKRLQTVNE